MMDAQKYRGGGKPEPEIRSPEIRSLESLGQECQGDQYSLIKQKVDQLDKQVSSTAVVADVF